MYKMSVLEKIVCGIIISSITLLLIGIIVFSIYCWVTYGGKPVGEIPFWALWFMWGN